jgi:hypothetical protein
MSDEAKDGIPVTILAVGRSGFVNAITSNPEPVGYVGRLARSGEVRNEMYPNFLMVSVKNAIRVGSED